MQDIVAGQMPAGGYSGLTKTGTALPRPGSKGTVPQGDEAPGEPVPYYPYCLRLRRLVLIFVNPL
ncbi:hypothetical protein BBZ87_03660 [Neisseria gonorrhoeae]|nr:hypothetical protein BBZ87_03660 [Neisseria gonorrhoeae]